MRYTMQHVIETGATAFWRLFFDLEFNRALVRDYASFELVDERTDPSGIVHRKLEYTAKVELPGFVKKLVGDGRYTEIGRYDPATRTYVAQSVPTFGAERFVNSFEVSTRDLGEGRCERILAMDTVVTLFGMGGLVESLLERSQRDMQQRVVDFTNDWIRTRAL